MKRKLLVVSMMILLGSVGVALYGLGARYVYLHHPGSHYFLDVPTGSPHDEDIGYAVEYGVVSGYWDATYRPHEPVTRQQMATFVMRASSVDPVVSTLIVDEMYFAGYYFGITALEEGRITEEEYETFHSFLDWWFAMSDYHGGSPVAAPQLSVATKLARQVMARTRESHRRPG